MSSWHSYPKIYNLGHSALRKLMEGPVVIEEKVDGSQFSFGVFDGEIKCRSKGKQLIVDAPEDMFVQAVNTVKVLAPWLKNGYTYRGEYLNKPKHNALAYDRVPSNNIILFDINPSEETYLSYDDKYGEADRLGLDIVPRIYEGNGGDVNFEKFQEILETISVLGGQKIEGLVIKNYTQFGADKKVLMGKHVSEAFKEVHKQTWGESNPGGRDILGQIGMQYKTPARYRKAIQHLREKGIITDTPQDIGILLKEINADLLEKCAPEIKEQLFKWAWKHIARIAVAGFPEWYKEELAKQQFQVGE